MKGGPLKSVRSILTEIVLLFAGSDLPADFYVASILLRITIRVFFRVYPADFQLIKEAIGFCVIDSHRIRGFAFCFVLIFCFTVLAIYDMVPSL